jgi:tripartite-type tricarboxylate transporter receptor subunit TctC
LAQTYPTRTITIVIAFPPGGPNEGVVRFLHLDAHKHECDTLLELADEVIE